MHKGGVSFSSIICLILLSWDSTGLDARLDHRDAWKIQMVLGSSARNHGMPSSENYIRRRLMIGSSPPTCLKKCGVCSPCTVVLVPIHSRANPQPVSDYYPEVWRCRCRGKIFRP